MADIQLLLEAEKRGLLPPDKVALLNEARSRGLIASNDKPVEQPIEQPKAEPTLLERFLAANHEAGQGIANIGAGALKGASQIGSTILSPLDAMGMTGKTSDQRRAEVTSGLQDMGANPNAITFKGGEIGAEIAGTAGLPGAIGGQVARFAPSIGTAITSGGFATGVPNAARLMSMEAAKNAAIRVGGGAVSGGLMAGAINPEDAKTGAVIGGAIPIAGKVLGESGKLLREYAINPLFKPSTSAIEKLVQDAGGVEQAKEAIDRAIKAGKTLSGESYTLGQAGKNAGLAATERARSAVNPENFQRIYQAQRQARLGALQGIAQDEGALESALSNRALNAKTAYGDVQNKVFSGSDDLTGLLGRARAGGALSEAQKIAAIEGRKFSIPVVEDAVQAGFQNADDAARAAYSGMKDTGTMTAGGIPADMPTGEAKGLLSEIRKLGGVSMKDAKDLLGEKQITKMGVQGGVFSTKGEEVGDMVRRLVDQGVMPSHVLNDVDGGAQALRDAIQKAAQGGDDMAMRAASEAYYGAPEALPLARDGLMKSAAPEQALRNVVGEAVKGGDLHSVKMGIDQAIGGANGHQKAALVQLKSEFIDWMGKQSPEYLAANAKYAADSRPINQMKVAKRLADVLSGEAYKYGANASQNSASFYRALKNSPSIAKAETGMKQPLSKIFDEGQMTTIKQVASELAKDVDLQTLGKGVGSDTAQKLARNSILSSITPMIATSRISRLGQGLALAGRAIKEGSHLRINSQLDTMLQSPEFAGKALGDLTKTQRNKLADLLANPAVRALPIAAQSK
jgi:hypothetical protein